MTWAAFETNNVPLILCGVFYSLLCVFSIVTGLMYMSGKRALNPLELSDSFVKRLQNSGELEAFARRMGLVTFVVGIVQGLTAFACLRCGSVALYVLVYPLLRLLGALQAQRKDKRLPAAEAYGVSRHTSHLAAGKHAGAVLLGNWSRLRRVPRQLALGPYLRSADTAIVFDYKTAGSEPKM